MASTLVLTIFFAEIFFTLLKSIILVLDRSRVRTALALFCFFAESSLGLTQTLLLALLGEDEEYHSNPTSTLFGALPFSIWHFYDYLPFLGTEVLSVTAEASLIRTKLKRKEGGVSTGAETETGRKRKLLRRCSKWLSFIASCVMMGLAVERKVDAMHDPLFDTPSHPVDAPVDFYTSVLFFTAILTGNFITIVLSSCFPTHLSARLSFAALFTTAAFTASWLMPLLVFPNIYDDPGARQISDSEFAPYMAGFAMFFFSLSAFGMPEVSSVKAVDAYHVEVLEILALGMTGPVAITGTNFDDDTKTVQILSIIIPQALAIAIPIAVAYLFRTMKLQFCRTNACVQEGSHDFGSALTTLSSDTITLKPDT